MGRPSSVPAEASDLMRPALGTVCVTLAFLLSACSGRLFDTPADCAEVYSFPPLPETEVRTIEGDFVLPAPNWGGQRQVVASGEGMSREFRSICQQVLITSPGYDGGPGPRLTVSLVQMPTAEAATELVADLRPWVRNSDVYEEADAEEMTVSEYETGAAYCLNRYADILRYCDIATADVTADDVVVSVLLLDARVWELDELVVAVLSVLKS